MEKYETNLNEDLYNSGEFVQTEHDRTDFTDESLREVGTFELPEVTKNIGRAAVKLASGE